LAECANRAQLDLANNRINTGAEKKQQKRQQKVEIDNKSHTRRKSRPEVGPIPREFEARFWDANSDVVVECEALIGSHSNVPDFVASPFRFCLSAAIIHSNKQRQLSQTDCKSNQKVTSKRQSRTSFAFQTYNSEVQKVKINRLNFNVIRSAFISKCKLKNDGNSIVQVVQSRLAGNWIRKRKDWVNEL
jgi:hypothetical protein